LLTWATAERKVDTQVFLDSMFSACLGVLGVPAVDVCAVVLS
jgi:hypothetical protein